MPSKNLNKTNPEAPSDIIQKIRRAQNTAYNGLMQFCLNIDPDYDEIRYLACAGDFATYSSFVFDEIELFKVRVAKTPLLAVILLWAGNIENDRIFGTRHIEIMKELIEKKLILYQDPIDAKLVTIADFSGLGHQTTIDNIRCYKEWSIDKREDFVKFYAEFANWLSEASFGFIHKAVDSDRATTANRWLPFDLYVTIIKELAERERILAKVFYLGGARSLEEVLSLKIEDIDSKQGVLRISGEAVRYPKHVFEDLKEYINTRKKGYVFVGRKGDRIDHTVPYRSLKTVIIKLKLDPSFTFKDFVKNV